MKKILFLLSLVVATAGAGCCHAPVATTGWQFSVGRPPTVAAHALVNQSSPAYAMDGVGTMAVTGPRRAVALPFAFADSSCGPAPGGSGAGALAATSPSAGTDCNTLNDVCRRIDLLEQRLKPSNLAMPKPLP